MANVVENVSDDELPSMNEEEEEEEEEEDGEIPISPQEDKIVEDVLSDIRCGCVPSQWKILPLMCTVL